MAGSDFLTDARIRAASRKSSPYKLRDGAGLYLLVTPGGAKQWRLRYTAGGRESMLSLGSRRSGSGRNLQITPNGLLKAISTRELAEKAFD